MRKIKGVFVVTGFLVLICWPIASIAGVSVSVSINGTSKNGSSSTTVDVDISGTNYQDSNGKKYKIESMGSGNPKVTGDDSGDDTVRIHNAKITAIDAGVQGTITIEATFDAGPTGSTVYLDHIVDGTFLRLDCSWGPEWCFEDIGYDNTITINSDWFFPASTGPNDIDDFSHTMTVWDWTPHDTTSPKTTGSMPSPPRNRKLKTVFNFTLDNADDWIELANNNGIVVRNSSNSGCTGPCPVPPKYF